MAKAKVAKEQSKQESSPKTAKSGGIGSLATWKHAQQSFGAYTTETLLKGFDTVMSVFSRLCDEHKAQAGDGFDVDEWFGTQSNTDLVIKLCSRVPETALTRGGEVPVLDSEGSTKSKPHPVRVKLIGVLAPLIKAGVRRKPDFERMLPLFNNSIDALTRAAYEFSAVNKAVSLLIQAKLLSKKDKGQAHKAINATFAQHATDPGMVTLATFELIRFAYNIANPKAKTALTIEQTAQVSTNLAAWAKRRSALIELGMDSDQVPCPSWKQALSKKMNLDALLGASDQQVQDATEVLGEAIQHEMEQIGVVPPNAEHAQQTSESGD